MGGELSMLTVVLYLFATTAALMAFNNIFASLAVTAVLIYIIDNPSLLLIPVYFALALILIYGLFRLFNFIYQSILKPIFTFLYQRILKPIFTFLYQGILKPTIKFLWKYLKTPLLVIFWIYTGFAILLMVLYGN